MNKGIVIGILIILLAILFFYSNSSNDENTTIVTEQGSEATQIQFSNFDLRTNTSNASIDLNLVLSGGVRKDDIPAINNPKFVKKEQANLMDNVTGILVKIANEYRYYPYNILVWHEIVNDNIGDVYYSVTFCPLCDSGIVFNRSVGGEVLQFGVSGLLFESNLLMYDTKTESLWSQARGEAVVGDYTGTKLELIPLQLLTFKEVKEKYPNADILSEDTGFHRHYDTTPYSGYLETEELIFPVTVSDKRFFSKELFYVFPFGEHSVAFQYKAFDQGSRQFDINGVEVQITRDGGEISVESNGKTFPGYFELWFSWATHHQSDGIVLDL